MQWTIFNNRLLAALPAASLFELGWLIQAPGDVTAYRQLDIVEGCKTNVVIENKETVR